MTLLEGEANEIPDDQEIAGETHPDDDAQLVLQTILGRLARGFAVTIVHTLLAQFAEELLGTFGLGRGKDRVMPLFEIDLNIHAFRDLLTARHRIRLARKKPVHILGTADEIGVGHPPFGVLLFSRIVLPARVDAEQDIVCQGIVRAQVVGIRSGYQRHAHAVGNPNRFLGAYVLKLDAVILDFDVEVLLENFVEPACQSLGFVQLFTGNELVEFPGQTSTQANDTFTESFQDFPINSWVIVKPFEKGQRGELDQVLETNDIFGEESEVRIRFFVFDRFLIVPAARHR